MFSKSSLKYLSATNILIGVNVALFIVQGFLGLFLGNTVALRLLGAETIIDILNGELWRMVTANFLHVNILHLLFNMYALWLIGGFVERYYSSSKLFSVYFFGGILGSFFSIASVVVGSLISGQVTGGSYMSAGASGAIFALMGVLIGHSLQSSRFGWQIPINRSTLFFIVGYNLLFGFLVPGINNAAHIGGLVAGIILAFILDPALTYPVAVWKKNLHTILFRFSLIVVVISALLQGVLLVRILFFTSYLG